MQLPALKVNECMAKHGHDFNSESPLNRWKVLELLVGPQVAIHLESG